LHHIPYYVSKRIIGNGFPEK